MRAFPTLRQHPILNLRLPRLPLILPRPQPQQSLHRTLHLRPHLTEPPTSSLSSQLSPSPLNTRLIRRLPKSPPRRTARTCSTKPQPAHPNTTPNPTPQLGSPAPAPSLSERLRRLSREYGWTALWVYLVLSAVDFPFCLLAVRMLGTERIGRWEHAAVSAVRGWLWKASAAMGLSQGGKAVLGGESETAEESGGEEEWGGGWGVEEADEANKGDKATWATQLALAYAVHKSFIFLRVPLTAAVLPRVVKTLRRWGWDIGKKRPKTAVTSSSSTEAVSRKG